uniref:UBC core domain-containing protein n=1 Tax=Heterorhabditis bacteriophora TaxID=37862 RepID=A0A1I7XSD4_HETBA
MFRIKDFTRPTATKEDSRDRDRLDEKLYKGTSCQTLVLEIIPSCRRIRRLLEEVLVVDRGFSIGETVIKYENEYVDDPNKDYLRMPKHNQMIGQVLDVRTRGDVLVVPSKQLVVKDVYLGGNDYIELINFNSAHNYIIYKDWIGDAKHCVNDVTLLYKDKYRVTVKEGGSCGVLINRRDNSDESKALVPGEVIAITLSELTDKSAEWEHGIPESLERKQKNHCNDLIPCIIEKVDISQNLNSYVETRSLDVDWVTSPCSLTPPEKIIPKNELNKLVIYIIVATRKEYYAELTDKYSDKFEKMENSKVLVKERGMNFIHDYKILHNSSEKGDSGPSSPKTAKLSLINECPDEQETREYGKVEAVNISSAEIDQRNSSNESLSGESEVDADDPTVIKPIKVSVSRHSFRQKRARKAPLRRRRRVSSLPSGCSRSAKDLLGEEFIGEVLMTKTLVDVEWMDGTIEKNIPGYMLIPHDPDLDQQDHLPGTIVTRKESNNSETIFGMIKSTNCAERSCIVSWFERILSDKKVPKTSQDAIFKGDEECTLFDIMAHPLYRRSYIGNFGVYVEKSSHDLKDVAYQVIADLKNGKQRVRYCNGKEEELWPFEMIPIPFGDEDNIDSEEDENTENTFSMDPDESLSIESSTSIHDAMQVFI